MARTRRQRELRDKAAANAERLTPTDASIGMRRFKSLARKVLSVSNATVKREEDRLAAQNRSRRDREKS
jgi:hypothetical protein